MALTSVALSKKIGWKFGVSEGERVNERVREGERRKKKREVRVAFVWEEVGRSSGENRS